MKTSVDFDDDLFAAYKRHCKAVGKSVTGALECHMRDELIAVGKLPGDPVAVEIERMRELIATRGLDAVKQKFDELAAEAILATGGSGR